jgi:hypothetical protein
MRRICRLRGGFRQKRLYLFAGSADYPIAFGKAEEAVVSGLSKVSVAPRWQVVCQSRVAGPPDRRS